MSRNSNSGLAEYSSQLGPRGILAYCLLAVEALGTDPEALYVAKQLRTWKKWCPNKVGMRPRWESAKKPDKSKDGALKLF